MLTKGGKYFTYAGVLAVLAAGLAAGVASSSGAAQRSPILAPEHPFIAKYRALQGSDAALDAVQSLHYWGTVETTRLTGTKPIYGKVEIAYQKPWQCRLIFDTARSHMERGTDGEKAWRMVSEESISPKPTVVMLKPYDGNRLRASLWQTLFFNRGIEEAGGRVDDAGVTVIDGIMCQKLAFIHPYVAPSFAFINYYDRATGRLVLTDCSDGNEQTREEGDLLSGGIHFARVVVTTVVESGRVHSERIVFDKITVNESFPAGYFSMPDLR